jgi:hypothetical protein
MLLMSYGSMDAWCHENRKNSGIIKSGESFYSQSDRREELPFLHHEIAILPVVANKHYKSGNGEI